MDLFDRLSEDVGLLVRLTLSIPAVLPERPCQGKWLPLDIHPCMHCNQYRSQG